MNADFVINPQHTKAPDAPVLERSQEWFPIASNQREIWFHQALEPESPAYNIGGYLDCPLALDASRLQEAVNVVVGRHDALRLQIHMRSDGSPEQRFLDQVPADLHRLDCQRYDDPEAEAIRWMTDSMDRALDLNQMPLFETTALVLSPTRFLFFLKCHHSILDGWAVSMLEREVCAVYTALGVGKVTEPEATTYRTFVQSQLNYLASDSHERDLNYWRSVFPSPPAAVIPRTGRHGVGSAQCGKSVLRLERPVYNQLDQLTGDSSISAFHAILLALHAAFTGFRPGAGMAVGLPILNRVGALQRNTAGMFVLAMPFWVEPSSNATHVESLQKLRADLRRAYRHRRCPLSEISRAVGLANYGHDQMFDVTLSFERHDYEASIDGVPVTAVPLTNTVMPSPLSIFVREFDRHKDVEVEFIFREDCLSLQTVEWFKQRFRSHLETFIANPDGRFHELPLLSNAERRVLKEWNQTDVDLAGKRTVVDLFGAVVEKHAGRIAVVDGSGKELDYQTLNRQANQIARFLKSLHCRPQSVVGVRMERGLNLVATLLGVLKAGLVYLPVSVEEARDRVAGIIRDADITLMLTSVVSDPIADLNTVRVLGIEELLDAASGLSTEDVPCTLSSPDSAYCIFTSGSTGKPKGVMLRHDGLANVVLELMRIHQLAPESRVLQFAATTFDASIIELLGTLCAGGSLHIPCADRPMVPDSSMVRFLESRRITRATLPPAVLSILPDACLPDLRVLISAGDTCTKEIVQRWAPGRTLINGYGPTEYTVCATTAHCSPDDSHPTIGRPIANTRIHIIDPQGREVPIGAVGELAIAGVGLAAGYLNRSGAEQRAFAEVPELGSVYHTGDLARWREDGQLEHLGRMDRQAKIRGSRVDPSEVEAAFRTHPEVRDAVIVAYGEAPMQWLAAYVASEVSVDELRHHLSKRLPNYMMPSRIVRLEALPLTPHGKVDFDALPAPELSAADSKRTQPRDALDKKLQLIWSRVLGVEQPGIDDDFFLLGGDSLKAAVVSNEIERELGVAVSMGMLFDQPTIRNVADHLREVEKGNVTRWPVILPLRAEGRQTPFFCFPGANAGGLYLRVLAGELNVQLPFYTFQLPGIEPGTVPLKTVEDLAALCVAEIQQICPDGPYRIGGHSFGGVIGFEVASRLEAAGGDVERLVVFDTSLAESGDPKVEGLSREVAFFSDLLALSGWDPKKAATLPVTADGELVEGIELLELVRHFLVAHSLLPHNCTNDQLRRFVSTLRALAAAHESYIPSGPLQAPITLFLAQDIPLSMVKKIVRPEQRGQGWGWDKWTRAGLDVSWVPGNHVDMLNAPHVLEVASRLNHIFSEDDGTSAG